MVDAVDDEAELAGEDVGELLTSVRVRLLDRFARLDGDEQGLEHAAEATAGENPVRPLASRRELARPTGGTHDMRHVSAAGSVHLGEEAADAGPERCCDLLEGRQGKRRAAALDERQEADREAGEPAQVAEGESTLLSQRANRRADLPKVLASRPLCSIAASSSMNRAFYQTQDPVSNRLSDTRLPERKALSPDGTGGPASVIETEPASEVPPAPAASARGPG